MLTKYMTNQDIVWLHCENHATTSECFAKFPVPSRIIKGCYISHDLITALSYPASLRIATTIRLIISVHIIYSVILLYCQATLSFVYSVSFVIARGMPPS